MMDKQNECWRCSQHILTIFLWTPRIGDMTSEKDAEKVKYYKNTLESRRDMDEFLPGNMSRTPMICATFNNWQQ